jgi:hypothetical protein
MLRAAAVGTLLALAACHSHIELQYTPREYAKLRNIELLTSPPVRNYELVSTVEGSGGRLTARETMINAMIDEARKAGADALIPLEFSRADKATGLDLFAVTENGRTITRGRAIRWSPYGGQP